MSDSGLQLAVTHLNVPVGPVLTTEDLARALRSGSVAGFDKRAAAILSHLFVELDPGLIARCAYEAGSDLRRANELYKETLLAHLPRETAVSLKLKFAEGEIDFIVAGSLLGLPEETSLETRFALEPLGEVLAKKLFSSRRFPPQQLPRRRRDDEGEPRRLSASAPAVPLHRAPA